MSVVYGEVIEFPAFLSRPREDAPPAVKAGAWLRLARRVGDWGLGVLERPMRAWAIHRVKKAEAVTLNKLNDLKRDLEMVQEVHSSRQRAAGHGGAAPAPTVPNTVAMPDTRLLQAAKASLDAFREIEGERALNYLLEQMLANSNERLARHGVRGGGGDSVAKEQQIMALTAQIQKGNEAFARAAAAGDKLRNALEKSYQDAPDDEAAGFMALVNEWDKSTGS